MSAFHIQYSDARVQNRTYTLFSIIQQGSVFVNHFVRFISCKFEACSAVPEIKIYEPSSAKTVRIAKIFSLFHQNFDSLFRCACDERGRTQNPAKDKDTRRKAARLQRQNLRVIKIFPIKYMTSAIINPLLANTKEPTGRRDYFAKHSISNSCCYSLKPTAC